MRKALFVTLGLLSSLAFAQTSTPSAPSTQATPPATRTPATPVRPGPNTPLPANLNISPEDVTKIRALQTQREQVRAQVRTIRINTLQAEIDALRAGRTDAEARAAGRRVQTEALAPLRPALTRWLEEARALERKYPGLRFDTTGLPLTRSLLGTPAQRTPNTPRQPATPPRA